MARSVRDCRDSSYEPRRVRDDLAALRIVGDEVRDRETKALFGSGVHPNSASGLPCPKQAINGRLHVSWAKCRRPPRTAIGFNR
jgi:hypothetical protein